MRISGWEVPEIAFANIIDKDCPIRIQHRHAGISIEHDGPLVRCVPMKFAKAAGRQAHVDASYVCGGWQFALCHLMGPATLLNALVRQIKGVPNGPDVTVISRRWCV